MAACSDTFESPKPPWRVRKETYLEHLDRQSEGVPAGVAREEAAQPHAILCDYLVVGDDLLTRFQSGREGQLWYYRPLADRFMTLLPGRMAGELGAVVDDLERAVSL